MVYTMHGLLLYAIATVHVTKYSHPLHTVVCIALRTGMLIAVVVAECYCARPVNFVIPM